MKTKGMLAVLAAAIVATLSASPTYAWPGGHSVILFDGDGFETECVDFSHNGQVAMLFFAEKAVPMTVTPSAQDPEARYSLGFALPNGSFGGIYRTKKTYVDCSCSRRGTPRYKVAGLEAGTVSCGCTATYWGLNLGSTTRTEPLLGVELGNQQTCEKAYMKTVLRPRLLDLWNQDLRPVR